MFPCNMVLFICSICKLQLLLNIDANVCMAFSPTMVSVILIDDNDDLLLKGPKISVTLSFSP